MLLPNRNGSSDSYRYGYQGSEKDDEVKEEGNSYTTHYRHLDPRVGKWLSIDPKQTAFETPYSSMSNNPILYNDKVGDTVRFFNMKNEFIKQVNNPGELTRIKVDGRIFGAVNYSLARRLDISKEGDAEKYVTEIKNALDEHERIIPGTNVISRQTGDFNVSVPLSATIDKNSMTGKNISSRNADKGIVGVINLNAEFDDNSELIVGSFNITSGPYGNGPLPNNIYSVNYDNATTSGRPTFSRTDESGMRLNDGSTGWKLRLPDINGRSGLLIHPDCNSIGTAGCMGIRENDRTLIKLGNFFENYINTQRRTLEVNFNVPTNPNYGNDGRANPDIGQ